MSALVFIPRDDQALLKVCYDSKSVTCGREKFAHHSQILDFETWYGKPEPNN